MSIVIKLINKFSETLIKFPEDFFFFKELNTV